VSFEKILNDARTHVPKPLFVALPDVVANARRTLELYDHFKNLITGPRALVLQDGIENLEIPWAKLEAIFVGGSDAFKESSEAIACCKAAKILNKWVHVGRVNTPRRVEAFAGLADSIDGSGISRYDHMLEAVLQVVKSLPPEQRVAIRHLRTAETELAEGSRDRLSDEVFT
jgi:hypothetical protein